MDSTWQLVDDVMRSIQGELGDRKAVHDLLLGHTLGVCARIRNGLHGKITSDERAEINRLDRLSWLATKYREDELTKEQVDEYFKEADMWTYEIRASEVRMLIEVIKKLTGVIHHA